MLIFPLFLAAAAETISVPRFGQAEAEALQSMYPAEDERRAASAGAEFEVVVTPEGRVGACRTLAVVGDPVLSGKICRIATSLRFASAHFSDGTPAYALIRAVTHLYIEDTAQAAEVRRSLRWKPDYEFSLNRMPTRGKQQETFAVLLEISEQGAVTFCEPPSNAVPRLAEIACAQVSKARLPMLTDAANNPVRYVTRLSVRFSIPAQ